MLYPVQITKRYIYHGYYVPKEKYGELPESV